MSPEPLSRTTPAPGRPVRGSATGRPLMAVFDLLGRRAALSVLWALGAGPANFRVLQVEAGDVAAATLNVRLRELREVGLIERVADGYALTITGRELLDAGAPLAQWARQWAESLGDVQ